MSRLRWLFGALGASLAFAGCIVPQLTVIEVRDDDDGAGGAAGGGGAPTCADLHPPPWSEACTGCMATHCCGPESDACLADASCVAAAACEAEELSPLGASRCIEEHPAGVDRHKYVAICRSQSCANECFGSNWQCAGAWTPTAPPSPTGAITLRILRPGGVPWPGITVDACENLDVDCTRPVATTTTGMWGAASFILDIPFEGFFELAETDLGVWQAIVPGHAELNHEIVLPTKLAIETQAASVGVTQDWTTKGVVLVQVTDCTGATAPDVSITVSGLANPGGGLFYLDGINAVINGSGTTRDGRAIAGNVEPGTQTVTATVAGEEVARDTINVRAGEPFYVWLEPLRQ